MGPVGGQYSGVSIFCPVGFSRAADWSMLRAMTDTRFRASGGHQPSGSEGLRWVFVGAGAVLILVAANMFRPPQSARAQQRPGERIAPAAVQAAAKRTGESGRSTRKSQVLATRAPGELIGELQGREYRVRIYANVPEATYDVLSADGSVLATGLTLRELPERFPDLDPATMHMQSDVFVPSTSYNAGQASGPLMYADEPKDHPR